MHTERPAVERPKEIEPDKERNAVRRQVTSIKTKLCIEDQRPLVYTAESPAFGTVHSFSVKNRKMSSSMKIARLESKKGKEDIPDEEGVRAEMESSARVEDAIHATPEVSCALPPVAKFAFQVSGIAMRDYRFVNDTSFNELEDLHGLETGSALQQNGNLVLVGLPYSNRSA